MTAPANDESQVRLRDYEQHDAETVLGLNQTNLDAVGPLDSASLARLVGMADRVLVAEVGGEVAGFVVLLTPSAPYDSINFGWFCAREPTFLYLDRVVVAPTHRRRGVGKAVYDAAEELARPYGSMALEVYVEPPNEGSLAFHAARGYVEVGRLAQTNGKTAGMLVKRLAD